MPTLDSHTSCVQHIPQVPEIPPPPYDLGSSRSLMGCPNCPRKRCTSYLIRPKGKHRNTLYSLVPLANSKSSMSVSSTSTTQRNPSVPQRYTLRIRLFCSSQTQKPA